MTTHTCPACESREITNLPYPVNSRACRTCGSSFIAPVPVITIRKKDTDNSKEWGYERFDQKRQRQILDALRSPHQRVLHELEKYAPEKSILDIGTGPGFLLKNALDSGWRVQGIEISSAAADWATRQWGIPVFKGCLEEYRAKYRFGVISLQHILEHQEKPFDFLLKCKSLLLGNGILWIIVPNEKSFYYRLNRLLNRKERSSIGSGEFHFTGFTPRGLSLLLSRCGFDKQEIRIVHRGHPVYDIFGSKPGWKALCVQWADRMSSLVKHGSLIICRTDAGRIDN